MTYRVLILVLVGVLLSAATASAEPATEETTTEQPATDEVTDASEHREFVAATAFVMDEGRWEVGLFGPLRYGLTDRVELSAHPLWFFVAPNLRAKVGWTNEGDTRVATVHSVTYPTPLLRLLAMEGAGGVLPPDRSVPHIFSIRNEVVISQAFEEHILTGSAGLQVAPRVGESQLISIDLPVVYPRTAAYFTQVTALGGVSMQGPITDSLGYQTGARVFVYPGAEGSFAAEYDARLRWRSSGSWMVQAGVLGSLAGYPFGLGANLLPVGDIMWAF